MTIKRLHIHRFLIHLLTQYIYCIVILSIATASILGCKTTDTVTPFRKKGYEKTLPTWPYVSDFDTYAYIQDKKLMALATKDYGLGATLLVNEIQQVYISKKEKTFVLAIEFGWLSFNQKVRLLKKAGATPVDAKYQYWQIHTEQGSISISTEYARTFVVSNTDIETFISLKFRWTPPQVMQNVESIDNSVLWFWSTSKDFLDTFAFEKSFNPEWVFMRLSDYEQEQLILAFITMPYHGSLEARTTLKLLFPFYLKNFMSMEITSLPEIIFTRDTLSIHGLVVSRNFLETLIHKAIQSWSQ